MPTGVEQAKRRTDEGIAAGVQVPYTYLGWAFLYTLVYGMIALLVALVLVEDRDLA